MSDQPSEDGRRSRSDAASRLAALLADVAEGPSPAPEPTAPTESPSPDDDRPRRAPASVATPVDDPGVDPADLPTVAFDMRSLDRLFAEPAAAGEPSPAGGAGPDQEPAANDAAPGSALAGDPEPEDEGEAEDQVEADEDELDVDEDQVKDDDGLDDDEDDDGEVEPAVAEAAGGPAGGDDGGGGVRLRRLTLRSAAFGVAFLVLVAAIPVLGLTGAQRLSNSRGGEVVEGSSSPTEPGFRVLVVPTPTALVVHRDDAGTPTSATLLSLGAGVTGGTALQIPLTTQVRVQRYYLDKLGTVYETTEDMDLLFREVEDRLGIAIGERIDLTDGQLAELVAPVAPLTVANPDTLLTPDGREFPAGEIALPAEDVGPFLRGGEGEDELGQRLVRNEALWTAWLDAVGRAGDEAIGAATMTGIGPFLRTLAQGTLEDPVTTQVETLDVGPPMSSDLEVPGLVPQPGFESQIIDVVPYPLSPRLGRRYSLKLLNGVEGAPLPRQLMHDLMLAGASLAQLGNAASFGRETTTIEISADVWEEAAGRARFVLGPDVEISTMTPAQAETEDADIVITVGSDVLDRFEGGDGG